MKESPIDSSTADRLCAGLATGGFPAGQDTIARFLKYLRELQRWGSVHNLTALTGDEDIIEKHFLDSLLFLKVLPEEAMSILDVGSGGGFPGIPMKLIRPELVLTLLEPRKKKAAFLRHIAYELGLKGVTIADQLVEDFKVVQPYDAAVARALFTVSDFVMKVQHIVKQGGLIILSKSIAYEKELTGDIDASRVTVSHFNIPGSEIVRYIVAIRNTA